MLSYIKLATAALLTFGTLSFAQEVTLSIDGTSLNYESTADIGGFQFDHDGCATNANGGDAVAAGFSITCTESICLGFSFSGSFIPAGSGTLIDLGSECSTLSSLVFSDPSGNSLDAELSDGGGSDADYVVEVSNYMFAPDHLNINAGETVEWVNVGGLHNVDGSTDTHPNNPDSFYSGPASNDVWSYSFTFTVAGNYDYVCTPHAPGMAGTITVGTGGCTDYTACNYSASADFDDGSCTYAEENYDCGGNCTAEVDCNGDCAGLAVEDECGVCGGFGIADGACDCAGNVDDCAGECGGSTEVDECGVCGGGGAQLQDCWFDGDGDGCFETLDPMTTCSCEWEGGSSTGGDCGSDTSNVDVLYCSDADIYGFQFNVSGVTVLGASGGAAEANGFTTSTGNNTVLSFSFSGASIPGNMCDLLTTLEVEGDASAACLSDLVLSGENGTNLGGEITDCLTVTYYAPCDDVDADGICDDVDDCVGTYDCADDCNGSAVVDNCGDCVGGSTGLDPCVQDCNEEWGGTAEVDECDVCGGDGTSCGDDHIDLSFGAIADGNMEILMTNTMAISGFQFNITGVDLDGASGGRAADAGFSVSTGVEGVVLGFSFTGAEIPAGSGVLTNLSFSALSDEACITNEVLALGEWSGGFYEINIGDCAALDYSAPSSMADVLYNSESDIAGFQFHVDGDVTLTYVSGGAAAAAGFMISLNGETNMVIGFSLDGSVVSAGSGTLLTLEYEGDGSPCLSDLILSDPDANGLDATVEDCLTIFYEAPVSGCTDVDACNYNAGADFDDGSCLNNDCAGVCGGSAEVDECGICGGDGSSCAPGVYGLALNADGDLDVTFDSPDDIYGFQFDVSAVTVTGTSGGAAAAAGFATSTGNNTVLGFSFSGAFIPAGSGVLTVLSFEGSGEACLSNIVISGDGGSGLDTVSGDCVTIEDCEDVDADGICDDVDDCVGAYDECGVCNGDGIGDGACDCAGNVEDCAGVCGGSAENCPGWEDDPGAYEFTATIAGAIVLYDGVQLGEAGDLLAALDADGNVRGVGLMLFPPFGPYQGTPVYEVQLRSNAAGDLLHFQYYDASTDEVLDISETYEFVINDVIGDVIEPWTLNIQTTVDLSIDLIAGWNWISFNVDPEDASLASVLATVGETATFINSQSSGTATNYGDYGWYGGLTSLDPTQMYLLDMSEAATLTVTGVPVDVASRPIDLISGWNWIGYLPQNAGDVATALASVGDLATFINSQSSGTATNYGDYGWYGGLTTLEPGSGYLLDMSGAGTLVYPEFDGLARLDANKLEVVLKDAISDWDFNYADYEFIGTIHASIESRIDFDKDVVAVFVDDQCRGIAERMYFPFDDSYFYIVQVYSNIAEGEEMTFKYFDSENGEVVEYAETMMFTSNMVVGDGFNTFSLSREVGDLQQPMTYGISDAYPNPFNPVTSFEYTLEKDGMVQVAIYDINGRMVSELVNGYQSAGTYPVVWDAKELSSGVYMVNMISGDYSTIQKVMLIKQEYVDYQDNN